MRIILLLCLSFCSIGLMGQDRSTESVGTTSPMYNYFLGRFAVTATAGTPSFATSDLKNVSLKNVSLGQLTISYKMNPKLSFGISTMGSLSSAKGGYYNAENKFFSFCDDDDDLDDDPNELPDTDMVEDHDDDGCDEDGIGQNLLGTVTYTLSSKLPFFVQAGGGYTFAGKAPAYTAMVGYNQKLFAGFGVIAGVRFSDVLYQKPASAIRTTSGAGLKAELGLSWNF